MKVNYISIEKRAREIARNQGTLAASPFSVDQNGGRTLCAAACIAYAGYEIYNGRVVADELFSQNKKKLRKDSILENAFLDLGLPAELCERIRAENDAMPTHLRLSWFTSTNFLPHDCS